MEQDKKDQKKDNDDVIRIISQLKTEIVERKWAEKKARDALDYSESIIDSVKHPLIVLDESRKVISANLAFYDLFNLTPGAVLGKNFSALAEGLFDFDEMNNLLMGKPGIKPHIVEMDRSFNLIGRKFLKAAVQGLQYNIKHLNFSFLTIEDVTEQKMADYDSSLGFLLVRNLVENQLNGVWTVREFGGLIHEIRFKIENDYGDIPVPLAEEIV